MLGRTNGGDRSHRFRNGRFRRSRSQPERQPGFTTAKLFHVILWPVDARQLRQRRLDLGGNFDVAGGGGVPEDEAIEATGPALAEAA